MSRVLLSRAAISLAALVLGLPAHAATVDPAVDAALKAAPDARARVLVKLSGEADLSAAARIEDWNERGWAVYRALTGTADSVQAPLLQRLQSSRAAGHFTDVQRFWIVNLISLEADRVAIDALAASPEVEAILPPMKLEAPVLVPELPEAAPTAIEWGVSKIRAPEVWSTYSTTGAGVVAANVDTGVQFNHPALVNQYRGNLGGGNFNHNYNWFDPTGATTVPTAVEGSHGTHVMGTEIGDDGAGNQIGVAPGAKWMAAYGCCPNNEALLLAQQFMLAPTDLAGNNPDPSRRPHVLNQSWGGPGGSQIFEDVIAALRASGVFPAFSAGNSGGNGCGSLGSPGDNPSSFNVASTNSSDGISSSSSRGPNPITGKVGPEVAAPGVSVRSSVPTNSYSVFSGTSMASPHVAGAVALLISLEPKLMGQVEQLEELLRKTAVPLNVAQTCGGVNAATAVPNNAFGWGRIDVKAAADMVYQAGWLQGSVLVGGVPTAGVVVSFSRLGDTLTTTTDSAGNYRVVAGAGSYAMSASYQGQTVNAAGVVVAQDATTQQDFAIGGAQYFTLAGQFQPAAPAMIVVVGDETVPPAWGDASGNFSIQIPAAGGDIRIVHPGYQTQVMRVNGSPGGTVNQIISLTPAQNYLCRDNTEAGGPTYAWTDATAGTAYNLDDDASSASITLPGTFTYFGTDYTTVRINSNGFLYFGATSFSSANMYLPFEGIPNNDVMAFGEDLNPALGTQGSIHSQVRGSSLVVQYTQVQHWASGFPETFQIILDTASDTVTYQYHTLSWPEFATAGVENASGSQGQLYSYRNSAGLVSGRAVQFSPAIGAAVNWGCDHAFTLSVSDNADPVPAGSTITYRIHWNTVGYGGAPGTSVSADIPAGATFVDASGGVTPVAGTLTWNLGDVRPAADGDLWFRVTAASPTTLNTGATISDNSGEVRSTTETTTVGAAAENLFQNGFEGN